MPYKHSDKNSGGDTGLIACGLDLDELFADSALGLTEIMTDLEKLEEKRDFVIELKSDDLTGLYYDWLAEIIYLKDAEQFLLKRVEFIDLNMSGRLKAKLFGDEIDPKRHLLKIDVKAVTYYKFNIEKNENGWSGEVVFDL